jgi:hypothetical protein
MNKTYRYSHFLIFITLSFFLLPGCKKESTNARVPVTAADVKLERLIQSFKKKITSNLKDGELLGVDSIRWYLEAGANFDMGNASVKKENMAIDSFLLRIPINQNYTTLNNVEIAYNSIYENVTTFSNTIPSADKQVIYVSVQQTSQTDDTLQLKVTSAIVYDFIITSGLFQPGQDWKYGDWLGNCSGNYQGQDAATEIQRRIMLRKPVPIGSYYYLDPIDVNIEALDYPYPGAPQTNTGYCYMFFENSVWPNFHICLPYTECNFYLQGTEHVIYTDDSNGGAKPTTLNYSFISLDLYGGLLLNSTYYYHYGTVHYGTLHQKGIQE